MPLHIFFSPQSKEQIEGKIGETLQNYFMFVCGLADSRWGSRILTLVFGRLN